MDDRLKCQTAAATPAEPGELPFWFRNPVLQNKSDRTQKKIYFETEFI